METTRYDPAIIQTFADMLYAEARRVVFTYTLSGIVIGAFAGSYCAHDEVTRIQYPVGGAVIFALIGMLASQSRAFRLRLQAQIILCQVQIEKNTRSDKVAV